MSITALSFSDLLLLPDGISMLKGTPEVGDKLLPVPETCLDECERLRTRLMEEFLNRRVPNESGSQEVPDSIRFCHDEVHYRVVDIRDVKNGQSWILRRLAPAVPELSALGFPAHLAEWLLAPEQHQGLVLITGSQTSGKTTTASALVAERLKKYGGHALTFEYPAELPLGGPWGTHGYCIQTEILNEKALALQIERAYRYASANVLLIGEIRTRYAALEAVRVAQSSSRQIVVATLHAQDVPSALDRMSTWAKELDGNAAHNLASSLLAVVHQDLQCNTGKLVLRVPQFLLVPFIKEDTDKFKSISIRAKIRDGTPHLLMDDIREQRNKLSYNRPMVA